MSKFKAQIKSLQNEIAESQRIAQEKLIKDQGTLIELQSIDWAFGDLVQDTTPYTTYAKRQVTLNPVSSVQDAIDYVQRLTSLGSGSKAAPRGMCIEKGGCTSFKPSVQVDPTKLSSAIYIGMYALDLKGIQGYAPTLELFFFCDIDEDIYKVIIPINSSEIKRSFDVAYIKGETIISNVRVTGYQQWFNNYIKWWASQDQPNDFTFYNKKG